MKLLVNLITKNWLSKLISLIIAIVIWFLIRQQVNYEPFIIREPIPNAQWTD